MTGVLSGVCASFSIYIYFVMLHAEINLMERIVIIMRLVAINY